MTDRPTTTLPIAPVWIVAFSGHRPGPEPGRSRAELAACRNALHLVLAQLQRTASAAGGEIHLHCSLAEGADLLAVAVAESLGITVHLILPRPEESFREAFADSPPEAWAAVEAALAHAGDARTPWTLRIATSDHIAPDCYYDANVQMLRIADVLVTIHKPGVRGGRGSTAEMVELVQCAEVPIQVISIDPTDRLGEAPACTWDPARAPLGEADQWLADLNCDLRDPRWRQAEVLEQRDGEEEMWQLHKALDHVAVNASKMFRGCLERSIWQHFGATVLAGLGAAFAVQLHHRWKFAPAVVCLIEFLLVGCAFLCLRRAKSSDANHVWRRTRLGAEFVDSQIQSACLVDPLYPPIMRYGRRWTGFGIAVALAVHGQRDSLLADLGPEARLERLKTEYLDKRIGVQLERYFLPKGKLARSWRDRFGELSSWASGIAALVILAALALKLSHAAPPGGHAYESDPLTATAVFFTIFFPLVASLAAALSGAKAAPRRAHRYEEGRDRLQRVSCMIRGARTEAALRRLVPEAEDILLDDLIDWHTTAAVTGH